MNLGIVLLCLVQGTPEAAGPPAPEAHTTAWKPFNAINLIVNEEAITVRDITREQLRRNRPATTQAESQEQRYDIVNDYLERMLTIQAGKDLGFDESLIERYVRDELQGQVDRAGSMVELGAQLEADDLDPQSVRERSRDDTYGLLWQRAVYGYGAGPSGRPYIDRYVRPGRLMFEFRRSDPLKLVPAIVQVQELDVFAQKVGGGEKALELAQGLRARLAAGETMEKLGEELEGSKQGKLLTWEPLELARLQSSPQLSEFVREPVVGKVSEPLPNRPRGELESYAVLRILKLEVPDAPEFSSAKIQRLLHDRLEARQQALRREIELSKLLDAAYVWPPEAFGRAKPEPDASDG